MCTYAVYNNSDRLQTLIYEIKYLNRWLLDVKHFQPPVLPAEKTQPSRPFEWNQSIGAAGVLTRESLLKQRRVVQLKCHISAVYFVIIAKKDKLSATVMTFQSC